MLPYLLASTPGNYDRSLLLLFAQRRNSLVSAACLDRYCSTFLPVFDQIPVY